jgi:hypothetical protein
MKVEDKKLGLGNWRNKYKYLSSLSSKVNTDCSRTTLESNKLMHEYMGGGIEKIVLLLHSSTSLAEAIIIRKKSKSKKQL